MIVVSLLLILAAVALLVLGLTGGSSALLIGSIVTSLLAAIALVIAVRRAATRRAAGLSGSGDAARVRSGRPAASQRAAGSGRASGRAARAGQFADVSSAPVSEEHPDGASRFDYADEADRPTGFFGVPGDQDPVVESDPASPGAASGPDLEGEGPPAPGYRPADETAHSAGTAQTAGRGHAEARAAGHDDFADVAESAGVAGPARPDRDEADHSGQGPGVTQALHPDHLSGVDARHDDAWTSHAESDFSGSDDQDPDYHRASSLIGSARSDDAEDHRWRHAPDAAEAPVPLEEFGEPDDEDPADEPLPQAVRPHDAVQVARLTEEVLVVDGRPRYHLADCPHLVGRLTESLPAAEAVELGFSPCGLCRPVDRLVARATHH